MFRQWFGEREGAGAGLKPAAIQAIERFCRQLRKQYKGKQEIPERVVRQDVWASGFKTALEELEGSRYCSAMYRRQVRSGFEEDMSSEELRAYRLHIYFYKSAFVRIFSLLDKLGFFLNDYYDLGTEKVKRRFSYFTVLRQMQHKKTHFKLEQQLLHLKVKYQEPLNHLRTKRNLEIHAINIELIDDQVRRHRGFVERHHIEPLDDNLSDLEQSFEMVCLCLKNVFEYASKMSR